MSNKKAIVGFALGAMVVAEMAAGLGAVPATGAETRVPVTFTGGYDTDRRDGGRPVVLIAAALGVPTDTFRRAFSGVTPARNGPPEPGQVHRNKEALLSVLSPYGITNDRLDAGRLRTRIRAHANLRRDELRTALRHERFDRLDIARDSQVSQLQAEVRSSALGGAKLGRLQTKT